MAIGGESHPDRGDDLPDEGGIGDPGSDADVFDAELLDEDSNGEVTTEIIDGTSPENDAVALAEAERDEYLDSLRRLQAEFENYKKRVRKQQADQVSRAAVSLVEQLLPVLDSFELAVRNLDSSDVDDKVRKGIELVFAEMLGVLTRIGVLAQRNTPVRMSFKDGELTVSAVSDQLGEGRESLPVAFSGEPLEIGFNVEFLRAGVDSIEGETVRLGIISPLRPGLLRGDSEDFRYLLMPIRLSG